MAKQKQITIRIDPELYEQVKNKCQSEWGIGMSPLIKIFLKSFVTQKGVGFYVGDQDLCKMFNTWLRKKEWDKTFKPKTPFPGPRLKDLYDL